jgi:hypothetical protein
MADLRIAVTVRSSGHVQARRLDTRETSPEVQIGYQGVDKELIGLFEGYLKILGRDWDEREIRVFGSCLHRCLFPPRLWNWIESLIKERRDQGGLVRLELVFPSSGDFARLSAVPWEYLYRPDDGTSNGYFLATDKAIVLSRYIPSQAGVPRDEVLIRRVLFLVSNPTDLEGVKDEDILAKAQQMCEDKGWDHRTTSNPTIADVEAQMRPNDGWSPDLVHIIGHGEFNVEKGEATLALVKPDGEAGWVTDRTLSSALTRGVAPQVVILQSCELGAADLSASFAGMAPQLVRNGVSCVVAMQYPIEVDVANRLSAEIYDSLYEGTDLDVAVQEARWKISRIADESALYQLGVPVIYRQAAPKAGEEPNRPPRKARAGAGYDFRITLTRDTIRCEFDTPFTQDNACEDEPLILEPHLETIRELEQWLRRWERIFKLDKERDRYLVPGTFDVLGTHLWYLAFSGQAGRELIAAYNASTAPDDATWPQLRVRISFTKDAQELATLPWEFLRAGADGKFLAKERNLVLGRFVDGVPQQPSPRQPDDKVRVLFVTTLPAQDKKLDNERSGLTQLVKELQEIEGVHLEAVDNWKPADIDLALAKLKATGRPVDIVHLVGLCKLGGAGPEVFLPDARGRGTWTNSDVVVNHFTSNPDSTPVLVVLHVVDDWDRDMSDHFEHLAPAFIDGTTSAVLAMQYPMPPDDGRGFVKKFYEQLALGEPIGKAVQWARYELSRSGQNARFGTPVLYMQSSVDPRLISSVLPDETAENEQAVTAVVTPDVSAAIRTRAKPGWVKRTLLAVLDRQPPQTPALDRVRADVEGREWPDDVERAKRLLRGERRELFDDAQRRRLIVIMVEALDELAQESA